MSSRATAYWATTGFLVFNMLSGGLADLAQLEDTAEGMRALGYPLYLMTILGAWKVLGSAALLAPGRPRLMAEGPETGLRLIEDVADDLADFQPLHAARAELLRRAGHRAEAAAAYERAIALCANAVERRYLARCLTELS